jgi:hypothetical protein
MLPTFLGVVRRLTQGGAGGGVCYLPTRRAPPSAGARFRRGGGVTPAPPALCYCATASVAAPGMVTGPVPNVNGRQQTVIDPT